MFSGILSKFKKEQDNSSASKAKERLQIIIASSNKDSDFSFMPKLEQEVFELVKKYIEIDSNAVDMKVEVDDETGCKMLELNVSLPDGNKLQVNSSKK